MSVLHVSGHEIELLHPTPEMTRALSEAKVNLSLASPLFSYTMTRVDVIAFSHHPDTAYAIVHGDISAIIISPDFFLNQLSSPEERAFVLYHELDHIFFGHIQRMVEMGYDREDWNYATDYHINLGASGIHYDKKKGRVVNTRYQKYMKRPEGFLYEEKFLGMSSDEIYDEIFKNTPPKGSKKSWDTHETSNSTSSENAGEESGKSPNGSTGERPKPSKPSSGGDVVDILVGDGGSKEKVIRNEQTLKAAAVFSELQQGSGVGNTGGEQHLIARIKNLRKPKIPWTDKLETNIRHRIKTRYTYTRWSPMSATKGGVIFPSKYGERLKLLFGVDTSGSMGSEDYIKALSELQGILDGFDSWEIEYVQCDTKLRVIGRFTSEDDDRLTDWGTDIFGGYGTAMSPIVRHAQKLYQDDAEEFDAIIILTDGFLFENDVDSAVDSDQNVIVVSTRNQELTLKKAEVLYL